MGWTTESISGQSVPIFQVDDPIGIVLFLHDLDGTTPQNDSTFLPALIKSGLICLGPNGGQSWWCNRLWNGYNAEQQITETLVPWIENRWPRFSQSLSIIGMGMGGQGALRLAFKHPKIFPIVAAVDAALDHHELYGHGTALDELYESKEQCRQDTAILHLHPFHTPKQIRIACSPASPWYRGNDRLHEKMQALGVTHQVDWSAQPAWKDLFTFLENAIRIQQRQLA